MVAGSFKHKLVESMECTDAWLMQQRIRFIDSSAHVRFHCPRTIWHILTYLCNAYLYRKQSRYMVTTKFKINALTNLCKGKSKNKSHILVLKVYALIPHWNIVFKKLSWLKLPILKNILYALIPQLVVTKCHTYLKSHIPFSCWFV